MVRDEVDPHFVTKVTKGALQTGCLLFKNGPTCQRYIETYSEIIRFEFYRGILSEKFVCQEIVPLCQAHSFEMDTLQDYISKVRTDYKNVGEDTQDDDFVDKLYESAGSATYRILHLSDLNIDPYYTPGATVKCRDFRCCHSYNGMVPQSIPGDDKVGEDVAGPFGNRGCDMPLGGTQTLLEKLKISIENEYGSQPDMIIVTGGVVTE